MRRSSNILVLLICILAFAPLAVRATATGAVVLWPSEATALHAQPDSVVAPLPDGSMDVKTGTEYRWPGVRMDFASGECDLSQFGRVVVAVSVNIYSREPSRDLPPEAGDKPMIVGEFHFGALDRGLFHTGLVATRDQKERAACYCAFVNACLDHPRFVGAHWFQWRDQPLTGRFDGENYQIGFVTVTDAPYPELVEAARKTASGMYQRRSHHAISKH